MDQLALGVGAAFDVALGDAQAVAWPVSCCTSQGRFLCIHGGPFMRVQPGGKDRFDFLYSLFTHPVKALSAPEMTVTTRIRHR